jgi:hypothetical protein
MLRDRGYLIPAIDDGVTDYRRCADQLRDTIHHWHPDADITIVTADMLPYGDQGGQANDWQMYKISPYHETLKLEADMIACSHIDHWWQMFRHRDMIVSTGCRDWRDRVSPCRYYRRTFDDNHLPDVYNAVTYWRVSTLAKEFFHWCRIIWQDWPSWRRLLKQAPDTANTDLVYAMAAMIVGPDLVTLPTTCGTIVHMKQHVAGTVQNDWTQELTWEHHQGWTRINTVTQWGLLHYHNKNWSIL